MMKKNSKFKIIKSCKAYTELQKGDIIEVLQIMDGGFWQVKLERSGLVFYINSDELNVEEIKE